MFKKATRHQKKLRLALIGPSGSGKTFSALAIASGLGSTIAVIDTERGSASLYSDDFVFDTVELTSFHPDRYITAIRAAEEAGYDVLIIDSLSHAWMGRDGVLEFKDKTGGDFNAWRKATPLHNKLVDAILDAKLHVIVTMRSKVEYAMEDYIDNGRKKTKPVKIGMQPVQRDGLDYEFDVTADLDLDNNLHIDKTRCKALKGRIFHQAGADVASELKTWLSSGAEPVVTTASAPADNGNGKPINRAEIVKRISAMYTEANDLPNNPLSLDILAADLDELSDQQLIAHGKIMRGLLDQAKAV